MSGSSGVRDMGGRGVEERCKDKVGDLGEKGVGD